MIDELGHYALTLALFVALLQATVPLVGAARDNPALLALARPAALTQFGLIALAFVALMHAYAVSDFSLLNVAENSASTKPLIYKLSGVWGNHEGSMLLWVLMLSLFGAGVAAFAGNLPPALRARVLAVQGMIGVGFLLFILLTSDPFTRLLPPPTEGRGLNPVLQDPGLAVHPPFLYLGYVGFSIAFCFAIAALIEGRVDPAWARWVRPWVLASWCTLTTGIAMGSFWAYYTLGWGGWWYWDPVENASFMPWLVGTALLHSAIVVEKRDALKTWTILLAILTFSLSLVGTFLVRSGVLTSVHAFASDPARGVFILLLLVLATGGSLALFAVRAPSLEGGGLFAPISREGGLILNNLLLTTAAATVLLGTLYPLFLDVVAHIKISVGPPYFNATFGPLMAPLLVAMAVGPLLSWKRADLLAALLRLKLAFIAVLAVAAVTMLAMGARSVLAAFGLGLAAWLAMGTAIDLAERLHLFAEPLRDSLRRARRLPRATWGMTLAHGGVAVTLAGIVATSAWTAEHIQAMKLGESVTVAGYRVQLEGVESIERPDHRALRARLLLSRGDRVLATLEPEKRFFAIEDNQSTKTAIWSDVLENLYVAIDNPDPSGTATVRIYHHPLAPFIWLGAALMALGGGLSLTDRRHRVGAPTRARPVPAGGVAEAAD